MQPKPQLNRQSKPQLNRQPKPQLNRQSKPQLNRQSIPGGVRWSCPEQPPPRNGYPQQVLSGLMWKVPRWLAGITVMLMWGMSAQAQAAPRFKRFSLPLTLEFAQVYPFDMNGDRLLDLVVMEVDRSRRTPSMQVSVYLQTPAGFSPQPVSSTPVATQAMMGGLGQFSRGPGLVLLFPGGVEVWPWTGKGFSDKDAMWAPVASLYSVASGEIKPEPDWVEDLNGDGRHEILAPGFNAVRVLRESPPGKLEVMATLPFFPQSKIVTLIRRKVVQFDMPDMRLLDIDGNGWKDVLLFSDNLL